MLQRSGATNAVGIQHSDDYAAISSSDAGIWTAAYRHAVFVTCGWLTSDKGGASNGVIGMVLPRGKAAWEAMMLDSGKNSSIRFAPLAGLGDASYAGCGGDTCEVDVLSGDVWLSLRHYAQHKGNLEGAKVLAETALANYLARQ